ncbi:PREDICTED: uncharacterized protein LOC109159888 [Ipomoea nil]|uniref:uncharacterized protein LOC109159888 n=1 Tax=Ipomoea nil TaxID=35883 RepID=UPI000900B5FD|nr:PREDICTED: uncharacterized protein LOC109159888 [Ipomoea nil]
MAGQFVLASQLTPLCNRKAIRVRLVRTYAVYENRENKAISSLECVFHDVEGVFVHCTIPKDQVQKWTKFKEGCVYGIKNFLCITNYLKFKTSNHRFMLKFKHDTMVKEYKKVSFPHKTFRLKSISSLVRKDDIDEKMLIDVIGRVTEIYSPVERVVAGQRARLIDFVLEDIK